MSPMIRETTLSKLGFIVLAAFLPKMNRRYVIKHIKAKIPITKSPLMIDFSAPTKFIAVEMVPGPESNGIPNGEIAKLFASFAIFSFSSDDWV